MYYANQRVQAHPATDAAARGDRFGTVESVGRKYVHVKMDQSRKVLKFAKDAKLLIPVNIQVIGERTGPPEPPKHCVGRKVWYLAVDGRKIAAVVDSLDKERHPTRLNLRITATKDRTYSRGQLVNTPPAFVQPR